MNIATILGLVLSVGAGVALILFYRVETVRRQAKRSRTLELFDPVCPNCSADRPCPVRIELNRIVCIAENDLPDAEKVKLMGVFARRALNGRQP